jgi:hypothetical protein
MRRGSILACLAVGSSLGHAPRVAGKRLVPAGRPKAVGNHGRIGRQRVRAAPADATWITDVR